MLTGQRSIPAILQCYPEVTHTDAKGKTQSERANKYFIMFGEEGDKTGTSIGERRSAAQAHYRLLDLTSSVQSIILSSSMFIYLTSKISLSSLDPLA